MHGSFTLTYGERPVCSAELLNLILHYILHFIILMWTCCVSASSCSLFAFVLLHLKNYSDLDFWPLRIFRCSLIELSPWPLLKGDFSNKNKLLRRAAKVVFDYFFFWFFKRWKYAQLHSLKAAHEFMLDVQRRLDE